MHTYIIVQKYSNVITLYKWGGSLFPLLLLWWIPLLVFHVTYVNNPAGILLFCLYNFLWIHILQLSLGKDVGILYTCQYPAFIHSSTVQKAPESLMQPEFTLSVAAEHLCEPTVTFNHSTVDVWFSAVMTCAAVNILVDALMQQC